MGADLLTDLPPVGAWRLAGAYEGFEVVRFAPRGDAGTVITGTTVGVEDGLPWSIHYVLDVADNWHVRQATVTAHDGTRLDVRTDTEGSWIVDGVPRPELDGCLDLDFEASVVTNTLPVHRLALTVGQQGGSAAAYVRSRGLVMERLDQTYRRLPDRDGSIVFDYESPRFGYRDRLRFAPDGLVVEYPGIGVRVALDG